MGRAGKQYKVVLNNNQVLTSVESHPEKSCMENFLIGMCAAYRDTMAHHMRHKNKMSTSTKNSLKNSKKSSTTTTIDKDGTVTKDLPNPIQDAWWRFVYHTLFQVGIHFVFFRNDPPFVFMIEFGMYLVSIPVFVLQPLLKDLSVVVEQKDNNDDSSSGTVPVAPEQENTTSKRVNNGNNKKKQKSLKSKKAAAAGADLIEIVDGTQAISKEEVQAQNFRSFLIFCFTFVLCSNLISRLCCMFYGNSHPMITTT